RRRRRRGRRRRRRGGGGGRGRGGRRGRRRGRARGGGRGARRGARRGAGRFVVRRGDARHGHQQRRHHDGARLERACDRCASHRQTTSPVVGRPSGGYFPSA